MSVEVYYYLANWNEFVARFTEAGDADKYYQKYCESDQSWLQPMEPTIWHRSHIASPQTTIFLLYEEIKDHLETPLRSRLETFLQAVALIDGEAANDLGDSSYFVVAMSPASVQKLLSAALLLDFEDLRPYYEKYFQDDKNRRLTTFDEVKEFLQGFVDIMMEAQRTGMGFVMSIA